MEHSGLTTTNTSRTAFITQVIGTALGEGYSIAHWRQPGQDNVVLLIDTQGPAQVAEVVLEETSAGFLFAPFDPTRTKLHFHADHLFTFGAQPEMSEQPVTPVWMNKASQTADSRQLPWYTLPGNEQHAAGSDYMTLVARAQDYIQQGVVEKLVPSRTKSIPIPAGFDALSLFDKLCRAYPHAMVSLVSSPLSGTWIGATPEILVGVDEQQMFRTAAVAGTQPYTQGLDLKTVAWTQKEIEEQALVERYIISCLKKIRVREFEELGPKTVVAGNVIHLKTEFLIDMNAINFPQLGTVMLKLLHPTSAVCGMPLEPALNFLRNHEPHDRGFYAGYLGPVNLQQRTHLYVNLRCLTLQKEQITLFAGAGVTADSIPTKELEETEMKMKTLLQFLTA